MEKQEDEKQHRDSTSCTACSLQRNEKSDLSTARRAPL